MFAVELKKLVPFDHAKSTAAAASPAHIEAEPATKRVGLFSKLQKKPVARPATALTIEAELLKYDDRAETFEGM